MSCLCPCTSFTQSTHFIPSSLRSSSMALPFSFQQLQVQPLIIILLACSIAKGFTAGMRLISFLGLGSNQALMPAVRVETFYAAASLSLHRPFAQLAPTPLRCVGSGGSHELFNTKSYTTFNDKFNCVCSNCHRFLILNADTNPC